MIDKEKVRELCIRLRNEVIPSDFEFVVSKWLEQNQPEPVVVGLTDEQVWELAKKILVADAEVICATIGTYSEAINEYLETQTFTQVQEVPVGLTDEQVSKLSTELDDLMRPTYDSIERCIEDFLKTQTFARPIEFSNVELADSYQASCEDFEQLKKELEQLKSQQIRPSWDDAPKDATSMCVIYEWYKHGTLCLREMAYGECRPKPTPQVEVGQVWKCAKTEVTVIAMNDDDVVFQKQSGSFLIYSIAEFLAKFERVGE